MPEQDVVRLHHGPASAALALTGAEPVSWMVDGRELIWGGDPGFWAGQAPILFPVVGASAGGVVRVEGRAHPMPQHGFARRLPFSLAERTEDSACLVLRDSTETLAAYPFPFRLDVIAHLDEDTLALTFAVTNTGSAEMPFSLGFHPAFPWPFDGGPREAYAVAFEGDETGAIPDVAPGGLLRRGSRRLALDGRRLALDPSLFAEALCFLDARSRSLRFLSPSGTSITMETDGFAHLALWTKPEAPFLSLEAWTGHADWDGFSGELRERASITLLAPRATHRHRVQLVWRPAQA